MRYNPFNVVLYNIYVVYDKYIYGNTFKAMMGETTPKVHAILIHSLFQWLLLFYGILTYIAIKFFGFDIPNYVYYLGFAALALMNFNRYSIKAGRFDELVNTQPKFFSSRAISILITVFYITLSVVLLLMVNDYEREFNLHGIR